MKTSVALLLLVSSHTSEKGPHHATRRFGEELLSTNERAHIAPLVEGVEFGVVETRGGFYLLKRGADPARNPQLLPLVR